MAPRKSPDGIALEELSAALADVVRLAHENGNSAAARRIRQGLASFAAQVESARAETDRVRLPKATFDPFEPKTSGRMVALALLAQPLVPLAAVPESYGSGVYAIYYTGDHPLYAAISGTETPIYVGKADPKEPDASTPREQGNKLTGRLREHAATVSEAESYAAESNLPTGLHSISLADFKCRRLARFPIILDHSRWR